MNLLVNLQKEGMGSLLEEKAQGEYKFLFLTFLIITNG